MVKTSCFQCTGMGSILAGELRSHIPCGTEKKKRMTEVLISQDCCESLIIEELSLGAWHFVSI